MNSTKDSYSIYHDLIISATAKEIFDAVSLPKHLNNWWTLKCSGKPEPNAEYNFYFAPEYDWHGKVMVCEEEKSFHIKMTKSDSDWNPTSFGFDLEEVDEGIRLKFWHIGWPECNHHFRRSSF